MKRLRQSLFLFTMYFVLALPALGVLAVHYFTNNPFLRPLGITRQEIIEMNGQTSYASISVNVDWGTDQTGTASKDQFRNVLAKVLNNRTNDYVFKFRDVPGDAIYVTFVVGQNSFGPYPPSSMIKGVNPAMTALEMEQRG